MDTLKGLKRTKMCGEFRGSDIGSEAVAMGFVAKQRNLGNLIFMDLRDRSGIVQVSLDDTCGKELFDKAAAVRSEYVIAVKGKVRSRGSNINSNILTGEVEILVSDLRILSDAEVTPFAIKDDLNANDTLRLKYRYLDLRRPVMQQKLIIRDKAMNTVRSYLHDHGFLEIETPFFGKSSPEGAREYLVPSRVHPGCFYALPQSPQQYKQLLMIAGFDRYYQIARCFRDEDLRANRQPEFSQIDLEMSFVESEEDVMVIAEGLIRNLFKECIGYDIGDNIRRMPYWDAMANYGSDKPDTRFDMKLKDISDIVKNCGFNAYTEAVAAGGSVRVINAKGKAEEFTRKTLDQLAEEVKTFGAKGLSYIILKNDGVTSSIAKFLTPDILDAIYKRADAVKGDALFIVASPKNKVVYDSLGGLRLHLANKFGLIKKGTFDMLWVVDFPMFEYSEEEQRLVATHHPFTSPKVEDLDMLDTEPLKVRSMAYDFVINGQEAGGGSVRIHTMELQKRMFNKIGFSEEDIRRKFSFFVDAFKYGAPPHGGLAFGLDRLIMILTDTDSIRDVIAFPKVQTAACLMTDAPSLVEQKQLDDLGLKLKD